MNSGRLKDRRKKHGGEKKIILAE